MLDHSSYKTQPHDFYFFDPAKKITVFAPHPDDEIIGCGGSLLLHRENQANLKLVFVSDGAAAIEHPSEVRKRKYVEVRQKEAQKVATSLGVQFPFFWNLPDSRLKDCTELEHKIREHLLQERPNLIYCTSPVERHKDHRALANAVWRASSGLDSEIQIAFYSVNQTFTPNLIIDISKTVRKKQRLLRMYRSQLRIVSYHKMAHAMNRLLSYQLEGCSSAEGFVVMSRPRKDKTTLEDAWKEYLFESVTKSI